MAKKEEKFASIREYLNLILLATLVVTAAFSGLIYFASNNRVDALESKMVTNDIELSAKITNLQNIACAQAIKQNTLSDEERIEFCTRKR